MGRFLAGVAAGIVIVTLVFAAVLYFSDLEVVEKDAASDFAARLWGTEDAVVVPDVVGSPAQDARAEIEALGLEAKVQQSSDVEGALFEATRDTTIDRQTPDVGTEVPPDATVTLEID